MKPSLVTASEINGNCIYLHELLVHTSVRNCWRANEFAMLIRPIIFDLMVAGVKGPTALAKALNQQNVPSRMGKAWHKVTVHRLLRRLGPSLIVDVNAAQAVHMAQAAKAFGLT